MFRAIRNSLRLLRIVYILFRYDALEPLAALPIPERAIKLLRFLSRGDRSARPGQRLARALQVMGPTFVKLGQSLATRADLLGDEISADLSELQDRLPPFDGALARETIEDELGTDVAVLFADFDDIPVAAGSIAQVHFALTSDGEQVAVKILRPGIESAIERDLDLFSWVAGIVWRVQPALRRFRPVETVETFAASTRAELDLRLEAAAASELGANFADDPSFHVPKVDWRRTARRVVTLERVGGIPTDEREALIVAGHNPDDVLEKSAIIFFNQVFRDGFFHADMHPGNAFIDAKGNVCPVDFGIMGRVDEQTRRVLAEILVGFLSSDYERVADIHFEAGYVPPHQDKYAFMQACRAIGEPILGLPLNEISVGKLLGQLLSVTQRFQMETQPQLLLLQKTMVVAEGVGRSLNPNVNMWQVAQPLIERWIAQNLGPQAQLRETVVSAARAARRLPLVIERADRVLARLERDDAPEPSSQAALSVPSWVYLAAGVVIGWLLL